MSGCLDSSGLGVITYRVKFRIYQHVLGNLEFTLIESIGVPYGSRTRVAAVKEKGPIVIQGNLAAWIALYRT